MANSRTNELARNGTHQNGHGPFSLMRRMYDELERLAFGGVETTGGAVFVPRIDVMQLDEKVVIKADLPGLETKDVRITCDRGALVLEGQRQYEHEGHQGDMIRVERTYGRFQRVIPLPEGADPAKADARFENGVLEITIPAPVQDRGKPIEIKTGR